MLGLFADCLLLASRFTSAEDRARARRDREREDEEWLQRRRAGRFDARMR